MQLAAPRPTLPATVVLRPTVRAELHAAAAAAAPHEMVRLLAGRLDSTRWEVQSTWELPGAVCGRDHFVVDAVTFARAEAAIRAAGLQWLGFAHSHPAGPAQLSATDLATLWPECVQVLVAGAGTAAAPLGAFWIRAGTVHRLPVTNGEGRA